MKRILFFLVFLLFVYPNVFGQKNFKQDASKWFKINPIGKNKEEIVRLLLNDSTFVCDTITLITNKSLFYMRGHYSSFTPFFMPTTSIQIQFFEELRMGKYEPDTVLFYQIVGYTDTTEKGKNLVKNELDKQYNNVKDYITGTGKSPGITYNHIYFWIDSKAELVIYYAQSTRIKGVWGLAMTLELRPDK
jgi:hypothetical protein